MEKIIFFFTFIALRKNWIFIEPSGTIDAYGKRQNGA